MIQVLSSTLMKVRSVSRRLQPHASYVFRPWRTPPGKQARVFRRGLDNRSWRRMTERAEYVYGYWSLYGSEGDTRQRLERGPFEVVRMSRHKDRGPVVHLVEKHRLSHGVFDWWLTKCGLRPMDEPVIWWAPTWAQVDCISCLSRT